MIGKDYSKGSLNGVGSLTWRHFKETTLKSIVTLFLLIALMSQWYISYYVEDYYTHKPKQQGVDVDAIKAHILSLSDRTIVGVNFADLENLITFDCKK